MFDSYLQVPKCLILFVNVCDCSLKERQVLDIKFLYGCSKPTIALLYKVCACKIHAVFFLLAMVHTMVTKKIMCKLYKGLFWKCCCKSCHILRKNSQKLPHLDTEFILEVTGTKLDSEKILLSCLTSSQTGLIPLVDDHQSTYFTTLKEKKTLNT